MYQTLVRLVDPNAPVSVWITVVNTGHSAAVQVLAENGRERFQRIAVSRHNADSIEM